MKYGIKVHEKDSTPGFRESDSYEIWFDSEEERDKRYEALTKESARREDSMITQYVKTYYSKI